MWPRILPDAISIGFSEQIAMHFSICLQTFSRLLQACSRDSIEAISDLIEKQLTHFWCSGNFTSLLEHLCS